MSNYFNDFFNDNNYKSEYNYSRVKFGNNRPILEVELNEMQKIQEEARASIVRQMVPSGFLERIQTGFGGPPIIFNPNNTPNSFAIAPCRVVVNGYEFLLEGKQTLTNENGTPFSGYEIINLGESPSDKNKIYNFVFLEFWFEELGEGKFLYKHGNENGVQISSMENNIVDPRVGAETARRVGMRYRVRVERNLGLSTITQMFSNIHAYGAKKETTNKNFKFIHNGIDNDFGLYIAKQIVPDSGAILDEDKKINENLGIIGGEVYAIPMFVVQRRVKKEYGSTEIDFVYDAPPKDATRVSYRPDGLYCDMIVPQDIMDVRNMISFAQINTDQIFDSGFKKIVTGQLSTPKQNQLKKQTLSIFDGTKRSYNNRPHTREVVRLFPTNPNGINIKFDFNNSYQKYLYDEFNFSIKSQNRAGGSLTLSFKKPSSISVPSNGYTLLSSKIQYSILEANYVDVGGDLVFVPNNITDSEEFVITSGLKTDQIYKFRIVNTYQKAGNSNIIVSSKDLMVSTFDLEPPAAPTVTATIKPEEVSGSVTIKWNKSLDNLNTINKYVVLYKMQNQATFSKLHEEIVTVQDTTLYTYTHSGLGTKPVDGYNIDYKIYAVDAAGNISVPLILNSTNWASAAPSVPTNLKVKTMSVDLSNQKTTVTIEWTRPTEDDTNSVVGYNVYYTKEFSGNNPVWTPQPQAVINKKTTTNYTFAGLDSSVKYAFAVESYNYVGESTKETVEGKTKEGIKPTFNANIGITNENHTWDTAANKSNVSFTLKWDKASDNLGGSGMKEYKVYQGNTLTHTIQHVDATSTYQQPISGLQANTQYSYKVEAYDNDGNFTTSSQFIYKTKSFMQVRKITVNKTSTTIQPVEPANVFVRLRYDFGTATGLGFKINTPAYNDNNNNEITGGFDIISTNTTSAKSNDILISKSNIRLKKPYSFSMQVINSQNNPIDIFGGDNTNTISYQDVLETIGSEQFIGPLGFVSSNSQQFGASQWKVDLKWNRPYHNMNGLTENDPLDSDLPTVVEVYRYRGATTINDQNFYTQTTPEKIATLLTPLSSSIIEQTLVDTGLAAGFKYGYELRVFRYDGTQFNIDTRIEYSRLQPFNTVY